MEELIKKLCLANGVSGREDAVRDIIISEIKDYCDIEIDALGNIIAVKKNGKKTVKKIMVDAHMDEVGIMVNHITDDGFIKFINVGAINTEALLSRRVTFENGITGVICNKPVHLLSSAEKTKLPNADTLVVDIGAKDKAEAEKYISPGDTAVFSKNYLKNGDIIMSKAIDDRIGCAIVIKLIKTSEYAFTAVFSAKEEVGARGAMTAAYSVNPDICICVEATTASDIKGVEDEKRVCIVGNGPAVSFMDGGTLYDRELYNKAINSKIKCQPKTGVKGGNDSLTVHKVRNGIRTVALSVPTRYIHTDNNSASLTDAENTKLLAEYLITEIGEGRI